MTIQYFTPQWAAEAIVEQRYSRLGSGDVVLEPSCGLGAFLAALPGYVPAFGVEIDPALAAIARSNTGREIVTGDFRSVALPRSPTCILGNPPFSSRVFDGFLDRAHDILPDEGTAGFILPAYMLQTPSRVERYAARWSVEVELLPRTLWPRLSRPIVWCMFRKGGERIMVGFFLYAECAGTEQLKMEYRELLREVSGSAWASAVGAALVTLGGEADLATVYEAMAVRRPTANQHWQAKVRQTLQRYFRRTGPARYSILRWPTMVTA